MEQNKTIQKVGVTLRVITPEYTEYYYQNFLKSGYIDMGREYVYVPINFTPPSRNLNLDNQTSTIVLPNLPEIRQLLEQNNGFRDSIVESKCIFPDNLNATPYSNDLMIVASSGVAGMGIEISLRSPFSAIGGRFPSVFWTTGVSAAGLDIVGFVPEVPITSNVSLS